MSVVLMYHGVFPDNDKSTIDAEDHPYAVSLSNFTHQLDLLAEHNVGLYGNGQVPDVVISFDDGHASNLSLAAPLLLERNLAAYFFITTNFIDRRLNFLSSDELAELSRLPGFCVGSHGMTHRFFDDMSVEESNKELTESRQRLESICGSACRSISFPGGRFGVQTHKQLVNVGYKQWFGSQTGLISPGRLTNEASCDGAVQVVSDRKSASVRERHDKRSTEFSDLPDRWSLMSQCDAAPLDRVAIRHNTQMPEFRRITSQEPAYFRRKRLNSQAKRIARRVIGNRLYHGLYRSLAVR
ncbi:MAG: polysaccharide deacetylase family protein [Granulosicoccus sp.]